MKLLPILLMLKPLLATSIIITLTTPSVIEIIKSSIISIAAVVGGVPFSAVAAVSYHFVGVPTAPLPVATTPTSRHGARM